MKRLRVHAFEPVPETFAMLQRNVAEHIAGIDMVLHQVGVSSAPGTATFTLPPNSFSASMRPEDVDGAMRRRGVVEWTRAIFDDGVRAQIVPAAVGRVVRRLLGYERLAGVVLAPRSAV